MDRDHIIYLTRRIVAASHAQHRRPAITDPARRIHREGRHLLESTMDLACGTFRCRCRPDKPAHKLDIPRPPRGLSRRDITETPRGAIALQCFTISERELRAAYRDVTGIVQFRTKRTCCTRCKGSSSEGQRSRVNWTFGLKRSAVAPTSLARCQAPPL